MDNNLIVDKISEVLRMSAFVHARLEGCTDDAIPPKSGAYVRIDYITKAYEALVKDLPDAERLDLLVWSATELGELREQEKIKAKESPETP